MEISLYNKNGKPVAYISGDGETIFLWDGRPVAYLQEDKVYGWNGRQLGWFVNGTIFDIYGLRAGFIKTRSPIPTDAEPVKSLQQVKPAKQERQAPVARPIMIYGYSNKSLEELLEAGSFH